MKKYFILITLAFAITACKNDSKTDVAAPPVSPESASTAQQLPQPEINPEQAGKMLTEAKALLEQVTDLRKKVDALPDAVKRDQAAEIDDIRVNLEGMDERENMFVEQLNAMLAAPSPNSTTSSTPSSLSSEGGGFTAEDIRNMQDIFRVQPIIASELEALKERVNKLAKQ